MPDNTQQRLTQLQRQYQQQRQQQLERQLQWRSYRPLTGDIPQKQQQEKHNPVSESGQFGWHSSDQ